MNVVAGNGIGVPKTPGMAIASVVLGGLGLFFACFTGIPAAICGHVALSRIGKSQGALGGRNVAITGMVLGYVGIAWSVIFVPILASLTIPVFSSVQERGQETKLVNDARQVYMACKIYAVDHDGVWPERLGQLEEEMVIDDPSIYLAPEFVEGLGPGAEMFRLVRPGVNESELELSEAVLVSVVAFGKRDKWVVVTADGACRSVLREEAVRMGVLLE